MLDNWQEIIATGSALSILVMFWWLLDPYRPSIETRAGKTCLGALLGGTAVLSMSMAAEVLPGFKFDLRFAFIAASGLSGGPISALITSIAAGAFRLWVGGAGIIPGIFGILIAATIGSIGYFLLPSDRRGPLKSAIFSAFLTIGVFCAFFTIEADTRYPLIRATAVPFLSMTFATTLATILLFNKDLARRQADHLNEAYAAMVHELPDCLNAKDLNGRFIAANEATAKLMRAADAKELIGRTDYDYYPRELADQYRKDEVEVIRSGKPKIIDQQIVYHTGEQGMLSTVKAPIRSKNGKIIGLITHNRRIDDTRQASKSKDDHLFELMVG